MICCRTHVIQRNLRSPGGKGYVIPRGFGFDQITCANYTFEVWGWMLFAAATWTLPALMFIAAGAGQMAIWAKAKHARLRKVGGHPVLRTSRPDRPAPGRGASILKEMDGWSPDRKSHLRTMT